MKIGAWIGIVGITLLLINCPSSEPNIQYQYKIIQKQNDSLQNSNQLLEQQIQVLQLEADRFQQQAQQQQQLIQQLQTQQDEKMQTIRDFDSNDLYQFFAEYKTASSTTD